MAFTITEDHDRLTVQVAGPLDIKTSPQIEDALSGKLEGITYLTVDLADVNYVSSMGLRLLLSLQKRMLKQGEMHVINASGQVLNLFEETGFADILTLE